MTWRVVDTTSCFVTLPDRSRYLAFSYILRQSKETAFQAQSPSTVLRCPPNRHRWQAFQLKQPKTACQLLKNRKQESAVNEEKKATRNISVYWASKWLATLGVMRVRQKNENMWYIGTNMVQKDDTSQPPRRIPTNFIIRFSNRLTPKGQCARCSLAAGRLRNWRENILFKWIVSRNLNPSQKGITSKHGDEICLQLNFTIRLSIGSR